MPQTTEAQPHEREEVPRRMTVVGVLASHILIGIIAAPLVGCTRATPSARPITQDMRQVLSALDAHAAVRFPMVRAGSVLPAEMKRPVDWHWTGPADEAVRIIAARVGYSAVVPSPSHGPIVSIDRDDAPISSLLDEIASAAGERMSIEVDVVSHIIRVVWNA
jgi:defect in organelle trafficking protein DotD